MPTEKLYYQDAHLRACTAVVQECRAVKGHYEIVLDRTCFYPEGGGQPGDLGVLSLQGADPYTAGSCSIDSGDGNRIRIYDTHEKDGLILHYAEQPIPPGTAVTAELDWPHRFGLMQQHSGEHMISGVIHRRWGLDNVGFHMGADVITIDLSGELTMTELLEVEEEVNDRIWENREVKVWIPSREELAAIPYRSKKELEGDVRIVEFPDTDLCACCGTHVKQTGEIGLVKILGCEKFHGGVRVELLCGGRAARYLSRIHEQNRQISQQLSAKPPETAAAVASLAAQSNAKGQRVYQLEEALFAAKAEEHKDAGDVLVFFDDLNADGVRRACDALQQTCGGRAAVFSGSDDTGYKYAVGLPGGNLKEFVKELNAALSGRGGGKPFFVQGSVSSAREEITAFFAAAGTSCSV